MITASGLERALTCPASCALPGEPTPDNEWSRRGNALDAAVDPDNDTEIPDEHADDAAELAAAIAPLLPEDVQHQVAFAYDIAADRGAMTGVKNRQYSPGPFAIPGTADFWAPGYVGDAKSGFRDVTTAGQNPQLLIAACANASIYGLDSVKVAIIDTRHPDRPRIASSATVDLFDLEAFRARLRRLHIDVAALAKKRATEGLTVADVTTGDHCRYCPCLTASCPSGLQVIRRAGDDDLRLEVEASWAAGLTPQSAPVAYRQYRLVEMIYKRMGQILYGYAAENPIDLGNGTVFGKRETSGKESIDGAIARQVLRELYGEQVADAACDFTASKASIKRALRTVSPRGTLAKNEEAAIDAIRKAGGAQRKPGERFEEYTKETA